MVLRGILLSYLDWCSICWIRNRNGDLGLLILCLLLVLNFWITNLGLFYRSYFDKYSSQLRKLVPFPNSRIFCVRSYDCKDIYLFYSLYLHTAIIWNSLPAECFPLTLDLNGFTSRVKRHLLSLGSF